MSLFITIMTMGLYQSSNYSTFVMQYITSKILCILLTTLRFNFEIILQYILNQLRSWPTRCHNMSTILKKIQLALIFQYFAFKISLVWLNGWDRSTCISIFFGRSNYLFIMVYAVVCTSVLSRANLVQTLDYPKADSLNELSPRQMKLANTD